MREICFLIGLHLLFSVLTQTLSLTCMECEPARCQDSKKLACAGGKTKDPCGCCDICAKLEGDICGGPWNLAGRCDKGLVCEREKLTDRGICKRGKKGLRSCWPERDRNRLNKKLGCIWRDTIFCTKDCKRCCINHKSCNPNRKLFISHHACRIEQRQLDGPSNLIEIIHHRAEFRSSAGNEHNDPTNIKG